MSGLPALGPWIAGVLALATVLAMLRLAMQRRWGLLALQPALIGLLGLALLWTPAPPPRSVILLTEGAEAAAVEALQRQHPDALLAALPGAPALADALPVGDPGEALRQTPAARVAVVGHGLDPAQLDALEGLHLSFHPAAEPDPAIAALEPPDPPAPGQRWEVGGRLSRAAPGLRLQLQDPSGATVDETFADDDGRFRLHAASPLAARLRYQIILLDGERSLQRLPLAVSPTSPPASRGLLLAATPSPDVKFLRRWAAEAGIALDARIGLAPGLALQSGDVGIDPARLEALDLLIVDARSWARLGAARADVMAAVRAGLGLLLTLDAPLPGGLQDELTELGLALEAETGDPVELQVKAGRPRLAPGTSLRALPLRPGDDRTVALAAGSAGAHGAWTALGRGRLGVSTLQGSYQWVQQGKAVEHASHWAELWSTLARARPQPARWTITAPALSGRRLVLCGGEGEAALHGPEAQAFALQRDPSANGCAAAWPDMPGRWSIRSTVGGAQPGEGDDAQWIEVFERTEFQPTLRAQHRTATAARAAAEPSPLPAATSPVAEPRHRRALLLGLWLLLAALVWSLERRALISARSGDATHASATAAGTGTARP